MNQFLIILIFTYRLMTIKYRLMSLNRNYWYLAVFTFLLLGCSKTTTNTNPDEPANSVKEQVLSILNETRTAQYFLEDSLSVEDINVILDAGRNAMSGRNYQPWYFTAIANKDLIEELAGKMPKRKKQVEMDSSMVKPPAKAGFGDSPVVIALACQENKEFDLGLACQNMLLAAEALGYGSKIIKTGAANLNTIENRALLKIPENMHVYAILLIGKNDTRIDMSVEGVTGASVRKSVSEISTIIQ
jgi:nitroreductase